MNYKLTDNITRTETLFETLEEARGGARFDRLKDYTIDRVDDDGNLIITIESGNYFRQW